MDAKLAAGAAPDGRPALVGKCLRVADPEGGAVKRRRDAGRSAGNDRLPNRPGISVKLSALHPRYEATSHERVMTELVPKVIALARQAKSYDLNFTIDAEEADRLELSLDVIDAVFADTSLDGWDGFGLAIQAYQKRASAVIDHIGRLAEMHNRRMMVRLVKGAYWDTELKRAQERGLPDNAEICTEVDADRFFELLYSLLRD